MNFQQLEYIIAISEERHFGRAAKRCFVTQPTLSMMVQKIEEELEVMIFDRSKKPIIPTSQGLKIIDQARMILKHQAEMFEIVSAEKEVLEGELSIGIIPTLSPYLLPLFMDSFSKEFPNIRLKIAEKNTDVIVSDLQHGKLDLGLLATPLEMSYILEFPLFYERFYLYGRKEINKNFVLPRDLNPERLLLLEEGHCLRSQVIHFCQLKEGITESQFIYQSGSLETLIRLVEVNQGMTILPELAVRALTPAKRKEIATFSGEEPRREISIVQHHSFVKEGMRNALQKVILNSLPRDIQKVAAKNVIPIFQSTPNA